MSSADIRTVAIQALGTPSADDRVTVTEDVGTRFLAYYDRPPVGENA